MGFQYLTNFPLETARKDYMERLKANGLAPASERIPVTEAAGRTTFGPIYAHICSPHYNACGMDGIALEARLTFGASETTPVFLKKDQYVPVDTGDPLPRGCDAVVMIEDVIEAEGGVKLFSACVPWQHIRQIGEDISAGDMLLPSYTEIGAAAIGAMIAGGVLELEVTRKPVVGIIPTGDEIVPPTTDPKEGDILEFNSSIFSAMLSQWGAVPVTFPIVPDKLPLIRAALEEALKKCDAVILNAGSSAGREDFSAQAISEVGAVLIHGLAIKPGKPAILGYGGAKPILGVPGYPVSGIIVIEELLRPIVEYLGNRRSEGGAAEEAVLSKSIVSSLKHREFVRMRMGYVQDRLIASPLSRGSGVVSSFMKADGIMEIPQGVEGYESGETVKVRLLRPLSQLRRNLVAIGSHDPLMDELSDLLCRSEAGISMSSSHVGSMGGIMAVRRKEAHVAGTHLLDEATGEYNKAYIRKYFPQGGVRLVSCVRRSQGLMLPKGNPKNIRGMADLAREGMRYVNRQKGSGTRVLCDFLCRKEGIDTAQIYGYEREEYTHTSVAALIAADSADAGLGIYSAAKIYGLDFVPVCDEQYDLLIPDFAWDTPMVRLLIETMRSEAFKDRLRAMGGYSWDEPGAVRERF
jgi:putative molybdopterin biosynthesis protein